MMSVTKEEGGRLNAFAKEPKIEVISEESSRTNVSGVLLIAVAILLMALIAYTVTVS